MVIQPGVGPCDQLGPGALAAPATGAQPQPRARCLRPERLLQRGCHGGRRWHAHHPLHR